MPREKAPDAIGNGVDSRRIGERIWIYQTQYERQFGTETESIILTAG